MIISDAFPFEVRGTTALMRVVRNDGYCWGNMTVGAVQVDVSTRSDQYDKTDEEAARAFMRAAKNPANIAPAARLI